MWLSIAKRLDMEGRDIAALWRAGFARQSLSDFDVYDLLVKHPNVDECQRMHYLQMALEKAAKAHFWDTTGSGVARSKITRDHAVTEKFLPKVFQAYWLQTNGNKRMPSTAFRAAKELCREIDRLAPAVHDDGARMDNCEYPWEVEDAACTVVAVKSPLDHVFAPSELLRGRPQTYASSRLCGRRSAGWRGTGRRRLDRPRRVAPVSP